MSATIEEDSIDMLLSDIHLDSVDQMEIRLRTLLGVLAKGVPDDGFNWRAYHSVPAWQAKIESLNSRLITKLWVACLVLAGSRPKDSMIIL